jgi:hypothetical protein
MKRSDAKELFSSVWDDNEVIVLAWEKSTIEEHLGRKVSADEWADAVEAWEQGRSVDRISEEVSNAVIDLLGLPLLR